MSATQAAPKARRLAEREALIVATARSLAEEQGWEAVTTRRLAEAIGYSQPVLYGHFPGGRSQIVTAVALAGTDELTAAMSAPGRNPGSVERIRALIAAYLDFAERCPATYEAIFRLPLDVPFASAETPRQLRDAFATIVDALRGLDHPPADAETAAEVLWAALHGVATLQLAGRFLPENDERRVEELIRRYAG